MCGNKRKKGLLGMSGMANNTSNSIRVGAFCMVSDKSTCLVKDGLTVCVVCHSTPLNITKKKLKGNCEVDVDFGEFL